MDNSAEFIQSIADLPSLKAVACIFSHVAHVAAGAGGDLNSLYSTIANQPHPRLPNAAGSVNNTGDLPICTQQELLPGLQRCAEVMRAAAGSEPAISQASHRKATALARASAILTCRLLSANLGDGPPVPHHVWHDMLQLVVADAHGRHNWCTSSWTRPLIELVAQHATTAQLHDSLPTEAVDALCQAVVSCFDRNSPTHAAHGVLVQLAAACSDSPRLRAKLLPILPTMLSSTRLDLGKMQAAGERLISALGSESAARVLSKRTEVVGGRPLPAYHKVIELVAQSAKSGNARLMPALLRGVASQVTTVPTLQALARAAFSCKAIGKGTVQALCAHMLASPLSSAAWSDGEPASEQVRELAQHVARAVRMDLPEEPGNPRATLCARVLGSVLAGAVAQGLPSLAAKASQQLHARVHVLPAVAMLVSVMGFANPAEGSVLHAASLHWLPHEVLAETLATLPAVCASAGHKLSPVVQSWLSIQVSRAWLAWCVGTAAISDKAPAAATAAEASPDASASVEGSEPTSSTPKPAAALPKPGMSSSDDDDMAGMMLPGRKRRRARAAAPATKLARTTGLSSGSSRTQANSSSAPGAPVGAGAHASAGVSSIAFASPAAACEAGAKHALAFPRSDSLRAGVHALSVQATGTLSPGTVAELASCMLAAALPIQPGCPLPVADRHVALLPTSIPLAQLASTSAGLLRTKQLLARCADADVNAQALAPDAALLAGSLAGAGPANHMLLAATLLRLSRVPAGKYVCAIDPVAQVVASFNQALAAQDAHAQLLCAGIGAALCMTCTEQDRAVLMGLPRPPSRLAAEAPAEQCMATIRAMLMAALLHRLQAGASTADVSTAAMVEQLAAAAVLAAVPAPEVGLPDLPGSVWPATQQLLTREDQATVVAAVGNILACSAGAGSLSAWKVPGLLPAAATAHAAVHHTAAPWFVAALRSNPALVAKLPRDQALLASLQLLRQAKASANVTEEDARRAVRRAMEVNCPDLELHLLQINDAWKDIPADSLALSYHPVIQAAALDAAAGPLSAIAQLLQSVGEAAIVSDEEADCSGAWHTVGQWLRMATKASDALCSTGLHALEVCLVLPDAGTPIAALAGAARLSCFLDEAVSKLQTNSKLLLGLAAIAMSALTRPLPGMHARVANAARGIIRTTFRLLVQSTLALPARASSHAQGMCWALVVAAHMAAAAPRHIGLPALTACASALMFAPHMLEVLHPAVQDAFVRLLVDLRAAGHDDIPASEARVALPLPGLYIVLQSDDGPAGSNSMPALAWVAGRALASAVMSQLLQLPDVAQTRAHWPAAQRAASHALSAGHCATDVMLMPALLCHAGSSGLAQASLADWATAAITACAARQQDAAALVAAAFEDICSLPSWEPAVRAQAAARLQVVLRAAACSAVQADNSLHFTRMLAAAMSTCHSLQLPWCALPACPDVGLAWRAAWRRAARAVAASCLVLAHQPTAAWQAAVWAAAGPEFWRVEHAAAIAAAAGTWPHAWPATPEDSHMSVVLSSSMVPNMLTSHCGLLLADAARRHKHGKLLEDSQRAVLANVPMLSEAPPVLQLLYAGDSGALTGYMQALVAVQAGAHDLSRSVQRWRADSDMLVRAAGLALAIAQPLCACRVVPAVVSLVYHLASALHSLRACWAAHDAALDSRLQYAAQQVAEVVFKYKAWLARCPDGWSYARFKNLAGLAKAQPARALSSALATLQHSVRQLAAQQAEEAYNMDAMAGRVSVEDARPVEGESLVALAQQQCGSLARAWTGAADLGAQAALAECTQAHLGAQQLVATQLQPRTALEVQWQLGDALAEALGPAQDQGDSSPGSPVQLTVPPLESTFQSSTSHSFFAPESGMHSPPAFMPSPDSSPSKPSPPRANPKVRAAPHVRVGSMPEPVQHAARAQLDALPSSSSNEQHQQSGPSSPIVPPGPGQHNPLLSEQAQATELVELPQGKSEVSKALAANLALSRTSVHAQLTPVPDAKLSWRSIKSGAAGADDLNTALERGALGLLARAGYALQDIVHGRAGLNYDEDPLVLEMVSGTYLDLIDDEQHMEVVDAQIDEEDHEHMLAHQHTGTAERLQAESGANFSEDDFMDGEASSCMSEDMDDSDGSAGLPARPQPKSASASSRRHGVGSASSHHQSWDEFDAETMGADDSDETAQAVVKTRKPSGRGSGRGRGRGGRGRRGGRGGRAGRGGLSSVPAGDSVDAVAKAIPQSVSAHVQVALRTLDEDMAAVWDVLAMRVDRNWVLCTKASKHTATAGTALWVPGTASVGTAEMPGLVSLARALYTYSAGFEQPALQLPLHLAMRCATTSWLALAQSAAISGTAQATADLVAWHYHTCSAAIQLLGHGDEDLGEGQTAGVATWWPLVADMLFRA